MSEDRRIVINEGLPLFCARTPGRPKGARHFRRARCTCDA